MARASDTAPLYTRIVLLRSVSLALVIVWAGHSGAALACALVCADPGALEHVRHASGAARAASPASHGHGHSHPGMDVPTTAASASVTASHDVCNAPADQPARLTAPRDVQPSGTCVTSPAASIVTVEDRFLAEDGHHVNRSTVPPRVPPRATVLRI